MTTKKIILSRDVRWLNKMYGKWARQYKTSLDPNNIILDVVISNELPKVKETKEVEEIEEKEVEKEMEMETAPKMDNQKINSRNGKTWWNDI